MFSVQRIVAYGGPTSPNIDAHFRKVKETVDKWVEDLTQPTTPQVHALQLDIDKLGASIEKAQSAHRSDKAKIELLQKQLEGIQQDLTGTCEDLEATKGELAHTIEELDTLKTNFAELQAKFDKFLCPISAMSVLSAGQTRFLEDFIFKGLDLTDQERARYKTVKIIIEDFDDDDLPENLNERWLQYRHKWAKCLGKVFNRLGDLRGGYCHDEDRNPELYQQMSEDEVRTKLSDIKLGLNAKEINAVVQLHKLTNDPSSDEST